MSKVVCPFCFRRFERKSVQYRCKKHGDFEDAPLRKFFRQFNTIDHAKCPNCGGETNIMICPHCKNQIPKEMVKKKGFIISIIGAKGCGKTIYITVFINELFKYGYKLNHIGVSAVDVSTGDEMYRTSQHYKKNFHDRIYNKKECPAPTQRAFKTTRIPLIYELTQEKGQTIFLVLYDAAGESFTDQKYIGGDEMRYLQESDAIIYLLDTFSIPYVHKKLKTKYDLEQRYDAIANTFISFFSNQNPELKNAHFNKPIALTFSKMDAILNNSNLFENTSIEGMSMGHNSSFIERETVSLSEIESISESIRAVLNVWGESLFVEKIDDNYKNARFFGISALGSQPQAGIIQDDIRPFRVLDPLVWILHEFGFSLPIEKD